MGYGHDRGGGGQWFGMAVPCIILLKGFLSKDSLLHFSKPQLDWKVMTKTVTNGSSEFASNLVSGVVMLLFNARMLAIAGSSGVAASTITFYVFGLMSALYMGYMLGISPLLSYAYGAGEHGKLKKSEPSVCRLLAYWQSPQPFCLFWVLRYLFLHLLKSAVKLTCWRSAAISCFRWHCFLLDLTRFPACCLPLFPMAKSRQSLPFPALLFCCLLRF